MMVLSLFAHDRRVCAVLDFHQAIQITVRPIKGGLEMGRKSPGIIPWQNHYKIFHLLLPRGVNYYSHRGTQKRHNVATILKCRDRVFTVNLVLSFLVVQIHKL